MIVCEAAMNSLVQSQQRYRNSRAKFSPEVSMITWLPTDGRNHSSRLLLAIARDSRTICPLQVQLVYASC